LANKGVIKILSEKHEFLISLPIFLDADFAASKGCFIYHLP